MPGSLNSKSSSGTTSRRTLKRKKPRSRAISAVDDDGSTGLGDTPFEMPDEIPRDPDMVRVVSWNMQGASASNRDDTYITRAKAQTITEVLDKVKPHVFLLQEVPGGDMSAFEAELNESIDKMNKRKPKRNRREYEITSEYDRDGAGQRYMAISEKGSTSVEFGDLADYNAGSLFDPKPADMQTTKSGRQVKPVSKLSPEEIDVANNGKKPRRLKVKAQGHDIDIDTWHAPFGNGQSAPMANNHYSRFLSGKDATQHPDLLIGDLNISRSRVQSTYNVGRQSLASSHLDHVVGFNGVSVKKIPGLPTKQSLKSHYTFPVSDHAMIAADFSKP